MPAYKYLMVCANNDDCFLVYSDNIRPAIGDLAEFDYDNKRIYARVVMWWHCEGHTAESIMSAWNCENEDTVQQIKAIYRKVW